MRIDIWSDFACPFCYIGKRRLEKALEDFEGRENVEIVWRSFQLDPSAPEKSDVDMVTGLAEKYNVSKERAQGMVDNMASMAKEAGLEYNFDDMVETNTLKAHRLANYSKEFGLAQEMNERLLKAHFMDGLNISDIETLGNLAAEVGLNKEDTIAMLNSDKYIEQIEMDRYESRQLEISSVPFFVFDNKYAVQGAQPSEAFLQVLRKEY
ncbi:DsbA family oxidoreductase [Tissierella sp.]|uniref:DsbA family oxidoreductase n=1 Tax=Tissierella sp. TaxID=41274 RepID=UPI0028677F95|nr:DsbA family oxidoreductase [Tissierella sp.]MDR7855133.1 DsbA family oxidoreductase [Tissierella sp.]